ncbi:MAG: hypothetical protein ACQSGP_07950, partial [Frankia sp.]
RAAAPRSAAAGDDSPARPLRLTAAGVLDHPVVTGLTAGLGPNAKPSYLPARAFATAVLDLLAPPVEVVLDDVRRELPDAAGLAPALRVRAMSLADAALTAPTGPNLTAVRDALPVASPAATPRATPAGAGATATGSPTIAAARAILTEFADDPDRTVLDRIRSGIVGLPAGDPAKRALLRMLADANGEVSQLRDSLERWYDDAMARMGGWYKRRVQLLLLALGAALAIGFNVDTVNLAQVLWRVPAERAAVADAAGNAAGRNVGAVDTTVRGISALNLPIGWTPAHVTVSASGGHPLSTDPRRVPWTAGAIAVKVLGLGLTTIALSFGATFWFDALGKVSGLRNTGAKPAATPAAQPAVTAASSPAPPTATVPTQSDPASA